jgi:hypothetical protein
MTETALRPLVAVWISPKGDVTTAAPGGRVVPDDGRLTWRFPRPLRLSAACNTAPSRSPLESAIDHFDRQGQMFDGRPVFCATPWTTQVWFHSAVCGHRQRDVDWTDAQLRTIAYRSLERTMRHEYHIGELGGSIGRILDERLDRAPWSLAELDDLRDPAIDARNPMDRLTPRLGLTKRAVHLLVLVPR